MPVVRRFCPIPDALTSRTGGTSLRAGERAPRHDSRGLPGARRVDSCPANPDLAPSSHGAARGERCSSTTDASTDRPPTIAFAPNNPYPNGEGKDTLHKIEQTNELVVKLTGYDLREAMNDTSAHTGPSIDKLKLAPSLPI